MVVAQAGEGTKCKETNSPASYWPQSGCRAPVMPMAKSRKRAGAGNGAGNRARFHQFVLAQAQSSATGVAEMNKALRSQFPWLNQLEEQDMEDALADLRSATLAAAAGNTAAVADTVAVWEKAAVQTRLASSDAANE